MNIFQVKNINMSQTINSNRFTLKFNDLDNLINRAATANTLPGIQDRYNALIEAIGSTPMTSLELSLFSTTLPPVVLEKQYLARFNDGVKMVTKFAEIEDMTVTFWDYVNGSASAIIQMWHAFVGDKKTGAIGFKQDFVMPKAEFFVYGPDAPGYGDDISESPAGIPWLQKYEIVNIWPSQIALGDHSSETAEARKVTVTFVIDNIYPVGAHGYKWETGTPPQNRYTNFTPPATA